MYELIQVSGSCYYIQCPAKIGLVKTGEGEVCLIDSGSDKDAGKKVLKILQANGWTLKAIYNTHSHADHIGGNAWLQAQTGCKIYAPGIECAFTRQPILEPSFLYGGYPCKELCHKFLLAAESQAEELRPEHLPAGWEMIPLPGHFFDMVGFRSPEGVVYLADCLSSAETLEKYQLSFLYDVGAYVDTLERVKAMKASCFVPAHAPAGEEIASLAQINLDKVQEICEQILAFCREPVNGEELLKRIFDHYGLSLNFEQYVLVGSTLRSYLSWLKEEGRLQLQFQDNMLLWVTT